MINCKSKQYLKSLRSASLSSTAEPPRAGGKTRKPNELNHSDSAITGDSSQQQMQTHKGAFAKDTVPALDPLPGVRVEADSSDTHLGGQ